MHRKRYLVSNVPVPSRTQRWIRARDRRHAKEMEQLLETRNQLSNLQRTCYGESIGQFAAGFVTNAEVGSSANNMEAVSSALLHQDSGFEPSDCLSIQDDSSSDGTDSDSDNSEDCYDKEVPLEGNEEDGSQATVTIDWSLCPPEEYESELSAPLCSFTDTTVGDAFLMCLSFGLRHGLSWAAMEDLLLMINCLFGKEVIKASKYFFKKYMEAGRGKMTFHIYCPYCQRYLGSREAVAESGVGCPCGQTLKDISDASTFFLSLSLADQIKDLLHDNHFVEALQFRFQRRKTNPDAYEDIFDGELYKSLSAPGGILSKWSNMSYMFNTDGFPVGGKSGRQTCWPIYVQINELPPNLRSKFMLLAGIYVGKKEPNMNIFLYPFVEEANFLSSTGIDWNLKGHKITSKFIPLCACVDTPARHKILNTTAYNGKYGCSLCYNTPQPTPVGYRYPIVKGDGRRGNMKKYFWMQQRLI